MNIAEFGLCGAVFVGVSAALIAVAAPSGPRPIVAGLGTALTGALGVTAGSGVLAGQRVSVARPDVLPLFGTSFVLDSLGAVFVIVIGGVAVAAGVYGIAYAPYGVRSRTTQSMLPLFVVSMLLVPMAASVGTLFLCWELMAATSLVLVLTEHRRRPEVLVAGQWYAVMTHLGFFLVMIGLFLFAASAGGDTFAELRDAGPSPSPTVSGLIFVLMLAGFGSKAGIVPLHAWLPRAHPEAPSHVSALMSAAMVNLGIYGIVRVGFDLFGGGPQWWWLLAITLGAISAVYGILQAAVNTDLKRLLGYSTTENMGLVLIAVGAAGLFASQGNDVLAALALTAAFLHVVNHSAFKTLLFLAAGSLLHATGTRDLDELGGLRKTMPVTTATFGWGALAASALSPGTAFVSEWLLLQSLIHGLPPQGVADAIVLPVTVAAVALTAGLSIATFVKAFGIGFLARPRSAMAERATESPFPMLVAISIAGLTSGMLALMPSAALPATGDVASALLDADAAVAGTVHLRLVGASGMLSPLMLTVTLVVAAAITVAAVRTLAARRRRVGARLWDCGAGPMSARTEYTATSFAEPLQRVFDDVVQPDHNVDVDHYEESRYLVRTIEYRRRVPDRIEASLYGPIVAAVAWFGRVATRLAPGSIHRYLGYGFYTVCGALILLVLQR